MADMLTLYTNPQSRGQIARWMLEETGQPYTMKILEFGPALRTPEFLALNPMGKVPVLQHGASVITETAAICAYLAETFPEAELAPRAGERAEYYRWMFFAAGPLETAMTARALGLEAPSERRGMVGYGDYDTTIAALEKKLGASEYVAGGRFTAADVYVGSHVIWGQLFKTMPPLEVFKAYRNRLIARPAYRRANEMGG